MTQSVRNGLILATGAVLVVLLAMVAGWGPTPAVALSSFWLAVLGTMTAGLAGFYWLAKRMVGLSDPETPGLRYAAVVFAVLVGCLVSPEATLQIGCGVRNGAVALFVETPLIISGHSQAGLAEAQRTSDIAALGAKSADIALADAMARPAPAGGVIPKDDNSKAEIQRAQAAALGAHAAVLAADNRMASIEAKPSTAALNDVVSCMADIHNCQLPRPAVAAADTDGDAGSQSPTTKASSPQPDAITKGGPWLAFFIAIMLVLALTRAMNSARAAFKERDLQPAPTKRITLVRYPTWVAFAIYAMILVPAAYFSVGSLFYLRLGPAATIDLNDFTDQLNKTAITTIATLNKVPLDTDKIIARGKTLDGSEDPYIDDLRSSIQAVASQANARTDQLETAKDRYLAAALKVASDNRMSWSADQFSSFTARTNAQYAVALRDGRAQIRPCVERTYALQQALEDRTKKTSADTPSTTTATGDAGQTPASAAAPSGTSGAQPKVSIRQRMQDAATECENAKVAFPPAPGEDGVDPSGGAQFQNHFYPWLAHASQSGILIIGLIGFGLFGAAIRMMGQPDSSPVNVEDLEAARLASTDARAKAAAKAAEIDAQKEAGKKANEARDTAEGPAKKASETLRQRQEAKATAETSRDALAADATPAQQRAADKAVKDADDALKDALKAADDNKAAFDQTGAAVTSAMTAMAQGQAALQEAQAVAKTASDRVFQLEQLNRTMRTDIVVKTTTADGKPDYVVSGAAGRVLFQGLGAAFASFLAGYAGVKLLSDSSAQPSAAGTLIICFVAAVFAEDVWARARSTFVRPAAAPPPPPAGGAGS